MNRSDFEILSDNSYLNGENAQYIEELYEHYLDDRTSVASIWCDYFDELSRLDGSSSRDVALSPIRERFYQLAQRRRPSESASGEKHKQVKVLHLINAYRVRGHQRANIDPLGLQQTKMVPDLELSFHDLTPADMDTEFETGSFLFSKDRATLKDIVEGLEQTYCRTTGWEFMHIVDTEQKCWLEQRVESVRGKPDYPREVRQHILERLSAAEGLENYLAAKYPGTKRFGLEGGESFIPIMDEVIQRSGGYKIKEVVIGMAHRGRLNLLVNILGKSPSELIGEFDNTVMLAHGSGDVKYHKGFSSNIMTSEGEIHLALTFNPSHLEIGAPVTEGSVRARQDRRDDTDGNQVLPILVHGDAALSGQGVVMETFQMSQTRAYRTGGTLHVVINNQVGFTTSRPDDARSTDYCTDIAKMVQAPIFHVNGDDPEAAFHAIQIALDYRQRFHKDVMVDLVCYRRHGHNEADEPSGTQPLMYQKIKQHRTTRDLYAEYLVSRDLIDQDGAQKLIDGYRRLVETGEHVVAALVKEPDRSLFVDWTPYLGHVWSGEDFIDTSFDIDKLRELGVAMCTLPESLTLQRQVAKVYDDRRQMLEGKLPLNWGCGELLAYATLLDAGHPVRLTGEDCGRGTFSHRHAVAHSQTDGSTYIPLQHLKEDQPRFSIYDSLLAEEGVMAFEFGYASTTPSALVIWEAQFGDFANGAQVVIDQFVSAGESKWGRVCGLTLLLPHGYEGQGSEHSSARLERYLQLCAEQNMQVCVPTTPAQIFHLLRRQVIQPLRKPLIVMSPKSLLRHKDATSTLEELADGRFQMVIPDVGERDPRKVERIVLCTGKVYYDLASYRSDNERDDTAIVRLEQLYPFPEKKLGAVLDTYPNLKRIVWCQEEPCNQGAWQMIRDDLNEVIETHYKGVDPKIRYAGRAPSAAPAVGYATKHAEQQRALVDEAFTL